MKTLADKKRILIDNSVEDVKLNIHIDKISEKNLEKIYYLFDHYYKDNHGHVAITKLTYNNYSLTIKHQYDETEYIGIKYIKIEDLKKQILKN